MARSIATIQKQITDAVAADPVLSTKLTSTSKRAIWRLWTFITAVAVNLLEQAIDVMTAIIEGLVAIAAPGTPTWIQAQVFNFQYSATTPQVAQLINFAVVYPIVDPTLRIITRCSVTTDVNNIVTIKVAKGDPPQALSGPELAALQSYINVAAVAGVSYNCVSLDADRLYVQADIYYVGLYSSVIQADVIAAINAYISGIPFNGRIKVSDLELAMKAVAGVEDVVFHNVVARAAATPYGSGTALVTGNTLASRYWPTLAGYAISEDTVGATLADSLTFIPQ
jgi:hypothetical protein